MRGYIISPFPNALRFGSKSFNTWLSAPFSVLIKTSFRRFPCGELAVKSFRPCGHSLTSLPSLLSSC